MEYKWFKTTEGREVRFCQDCRHVRFDDDTEIYTCFLSGNILKEGLEGDDIIPPISCPIIPKEGRTDCP